MVVAKFIIASRHQATESWSPLETTVSVMNCDMTCSMTVSQKVTRNHGPRARSTSTPPSFVTWT